MAQMISKNANSNVLTKGRLPSKRSVNLAKADEQKLNLKIAIPAIILIIVAAVLFSKFLVFDRFAKLAEEENKVAALQRQIDAGYAEINSFGEIKELYAHYTYADMNDEELNRVDRILVLDMLTNKVMPHLGIESWQVAGGKFTVAVTGESLEQIDLVFRNLLENEPIVDYYMVNSAETNDKTENGVVKANVTVSLVYPGEASDTAQD